MAAPSAANGVEAFGAKSQLVTKLNTMPVVNASMGVITGWYDRTKESNSYMKGWFELGEKSVVTSLSVAGDIVMKSGLADKISGPLSFADSSACKVLEQVETKLPLLKSTPQEIMSASGELVQFGSTKMMNMKDYGVGKIQDAMQSDGYTTKMSSAIGSTIGGADRLIDQYLPETAEQSSRSEIATVNNGESPKQDEPATGNLNEALLVSRKLRDRLVARMQYAVGTDYGQKLEQAVEASFVIIHSIAAAMVTGSVIAASQVLYKGQDATNSIDNLIGNAKGKAQQAKTILQSRIGDVTIASSTARLQTISLLAAQLFHSLCQMASIIPNEATTEACSSIGEVKLDQLRQPVVPTNGVSNGKQSPELAEVENNITSGANAATSSVNEAGASAHDGQAEQSRVPYILHDGGGQQPHKRKKTRQAGHHSKCVEA